MIILELEVCRYNEEWKVKLSLILGKLYHNKLKF